MGKQTGRYNRRKGRWIVDSQINRAHRQTGKTDRPRERHTDTVCIRMDRHRYCIQTDRQTDRQAGRQTDSDGCINSQTDIKMNSIDRQPRHKGRHRDGWKDRQTTKTRTEKAQYIDRQTVRRADRHVDKETEREGARQTQRLT